MEGRIPVHGVPLLLVLEGSAAATSCVPTRLSLAIGAPPMLLTLERSAIGPGMVVVHVRRGGASDGGGEADCSRRYRDRGTARAVAHGSRHAGRSRRRGHEP